MFEKVSFVIVGNIFVGNDAGGNVQRTYAHKGYAVEFGVVRGYDQLAGHVFDFVVYIELESQCRPHR